MQTSGRGNVELIKERLPIDEVIGSYIKLEKSGKSYKARCPFHNEKSASFFISPDRGGYYCFGCNAKGDIFTFVEQFEGLDFRGALKVLAERAGVQLTFDKKADGERDRLFQIMEDATKYFEDQLAKSGEAKEYLIKRGLTEETKKEFRIGWAPLGWNNLQNHLKTKGWTDAMMEKVGLIKQKNEELSMRNEAKKDENNAKNSSYFIPHSSDFYDRFRGRIMFPITDSSGRTIAFTGRILVDDGRSAKYLNSPDMPLYDKSLVLFGLDKAKQHIRRVNYTILVEGQMDLIMSHQAGVKNAVASSGTAFTDETAGKDGVVSNLGLVKRISPNLIVAFDSDSAGRKAAMRAANIALGMGMDVKIADIEGGKDPADLVIHSVEDWKSTLRNAKQVVEFEIDNVVREFGIKDQKNLLKHLQVRVYPLILNVPSQSDRASFVNIVKDKAGIANEEVIWADLKTLEKRIQTEKAKAQPTQNNTNNSQQSVPTGAKTSSELVSRLDLVEKRLFGLLFLMEKEGDDRSVTYKEKVVKIAGDAFQGYIDRAQPIKSDILFEAETFYGIDKEKWASHIDELLLNFEEDLISKELVSTMQELKISEKNGEAERVGELAKKCQVLSLRKSQIIGLRRK